MSIFWHRKTKNCKKMRFWKFHCPMLTTSRRRGGRKYSYLSHFYDKIVESAISQKVIALQPQNLEQKQLTWGASIIYKDIMWQINTNTQQRWYSRRIWVKNWKKWGRARVKRPIFDFVYIKTWNFALPNEGKTWKCVSRSDVSGRLAMRIPNFRLYRRGEPPPLRASPPLARTRASNCILSAGARRKKVHFLTAKSLSLIWIHGWTTFLGWVLPVFPQW